MDPSGESGEKEDLSGLRMWRAQTQRGTWSSSLFHPPFCKPQSPSKAAKEFRRDILYLRP